MFQYSGTQNETSATYFSAVWTIKNTFVSMSAREPRVQGVGICARYLWKDVINNLPLSRVLWAVTRFMVSFEERPLLPREQGDRGERGVGTTNAGKVVGMGREVERNTWGSIGRKKWRRVQECEEGINCPAPFLLKVHDLFRFYLIENTTLFNYKDGHKLLI